VDKPEKGLLWVNHCIEVTSFDWAIDRFPNPLSCLLSNLDKAVIAFFWDSLSKSKPDFAIDGAGFSRSSDATARRKFWTSSGSFVNPLSLLLDGLSASCSLLDSASC
jgi:hypothetical protein